MDKIIKSILKKIESEGYEAYIVGGFVRDKLLKHESFDVDICTNALPKDLKRIFKIGNSLNNYGSFNFKIKKYNIDITTYRKESEYVDKRHPNEIEYVNSLFDDIKRRDFTINSLCMDKNENIIDLLGGIDDLNAKVVRVIGDANIRFKEDPLRMLRAIRLASVLEFELDVNTFNAIRSNAELINFVSNERIKDEISKILSTNNFYIGLNLLYETTISDIIGLKFDDVVFTSDILGMWSQISINKITFSRTERDNIAKIRQILTLKRLENHELFIHGLYLSLVAGEILGIDKKIINKKYKSLPVKSMKDINISGKEIIEVLNIEPSKKVSDILVDVRNAILKLELKNKKGEIKKYIIRKWKDG